MYSVKDISFQTNKSTKIFFELSQPSKDLVESFKISHTQLYRMEKAIVIHFSPGKRRFCDPTVRSDINYATFRYVIC